MAIRVKRVGTEAYPYQSARGVLQAAPIVIVAGFGLNLIGDGSAAVNVGGFIAGCAEALLIAMSSLKMAPKGTKFEEVSDLMQRG